MKKNKLIGLAGRAGSGKSTIAAELWDEYRFFETSFAGRVKDVVATMFGWDRLDLEDRTFKETVDPKFGITPRTALQKVGQGMKQQFGDDIWVTLWRQVYDELAGSHDVVVSDVRFENEAAEVRRLGGTIVHVLRDDLPQVNGVLNDETERGIEPLFEDEVLDNNSSLEGLYRGVSGLMKGINQ